MNEVLQKILIISISFFLFILGCASINTSSKNSNESGSKEVLIAGDRISFPGYSLSIIKPVGEWEAQQGLGEGELVLWLNKDDGSTIEIMASRSSRNLTYQNIALEFRKATCDLILQQIPAVNCEIVKETVVHFNEKEFFKVNIVYQVLNTEYAEKSVLYLYRTDDCVYHFLFNEENHDICAPEMMQSIIFLEGQKQRTTSKKHNGQTSLVNACYYGDTEIVEELLAKGAYVNSQDGDGVTALSYASDRGHEEIVEMLLVHGANVNARSDIGSTPLMNAAFMGHLKIVKLLIDSGANINTQSKEGTTALMNAAAQGNKEIVEILLANGADLDACEMCGLTALWNAISGGYVDIVKVLIEHGADVNTKANDGTTALMNAVYTGNISIVKILLEADAEVNAKANNDCTALSLAKRMWHTEIVKLLKQAGAMDDIPKGSIRI